MNLFFVRPTLSNIGNLLISHATKEIFSEVFGKTANIVSIPALKGPDAGGLGAGPIYDMNRMADAVVVGGGNLFENGQLSCNHLAIDSLRPPLLLMGLPHGRITGRSGTRENRTDSLPPETIRHLVRRSIVTLVRDVASREILAGFGLTTRVGGCPTLFLPANPATQPTTPEILISIRHPMRMCVPPPLQWRTAEDLRRIIGVLRAEYALPVRLVCHHYLDLEFAAAFPEASPVYFEDVNLYMEALRRCTLHVSYRLHGFLPCLAFGTHSIHLSYDERGRSMLETVGMGEWDVDLLREPDCVKAVLQRARSVEHYRRERAIALQKIGDYRRITIESLQKLKEQGEAAAAARQA